MPPAFNFLCTLAFDPPGSGGTRQMVKMLAGSVMRTFFEGEMMIFRNSPQPLFLILREGIHEVYVDTPPLEHQASQGSSGYRPSRGQRSCRQRTAVPDSWP
jgi:hypothetical protein